MRIRGFVLFLLLSLFSSTYAQMDLGIVPNDPKIRVGKLANGLTYYIRYNNWPEHRANFYIAQRVGSLEEDEPQRGLAHFLEHMCFNGTKHFKGNDLIRYCETLGVQFGADLNAYTSIDETVYNINNVPTARQSSLDSCLLILYDWADGLALDPAEIDKERGVIHEEWRMRSSAQQRMLERALPQLYPGSKYGLRMPIGLMSVIDNFKPKALRDYYEKWYRPDNQGIIVVGDVDVDHVEKKIKELFGGIKLPANPAKVPVVEVPDTPEPIVIIENDKEQRASAVELIIKHDTEPDSLKNTVEYMVSEYIKSVALQMLNARYNEASQKEDCPYLNAGCNDGPFLFARTKDAFSISAMPKEGKIFEALQAALVEARRAARYGFTATEYERAKASTISQFDNLYANREKLDNDYFYNNIKANFLDGEAMPSLEYSYETMKQLIPSIPLEYVNMVLPQLITESDTNLVVINFNQEKDGAVYPTREELLAAVKKARQTEVTPYVDNVKTEPLMKTLPRKGKIVKEKVDNKFGFKELTLSNGIKVILKKTDFDKDNVSMNAFAKGGSSLYGKEDWANTKVFNSVIGLSGLGDFTNNELGKAMAGKMANADLSLSDTHSYVTGTTTPKDMETMFRMAYLYFTNIHKDTATFNSMIRSMELTLKNQHLSPDKAFSDSVTSTLYGHDPNMRSLELSDLKHINLDRIMQIAKDITANPAAYEFSFIGNFEEDSIRPLIEQYIASLPAKKKVKVGHRIGNYAKGYLNNNFTRKMETPKATAVVVWHNDKMKWSQENTIKAEIVGKLLEMEYLKKIREDASAAYSVGAMGQQSHHDDGYTVVTILAQCPMKPEKADIATSIMRQEVDSLADRCNAENLDKVKTLLVRQNEEQQKDNGYWSGIIDKYVHYGVDWHTNTEKIIKAITPQDICNFMKEFLKGKNRVEVTMMPQN